MDSILLAVRCYPNIRNHIWLHFSESLQVGSFLSAASHVRLWTVCKAHLRSYPFCHVQNSWCLGVLQTRLNPSLTSMFLASICWKVCKALVQGISSTNKAVEPAAQDEKHSIMHQIWTNFVFQGPIDNTLMFKVTCQVPWLFIPGLPWWQAITHLRLTFVSRIPVSMI